ncbi:hypothetical protein [Ralstonia pseudosolanacearum]|uniref:DUF4261 domain-containing protein n=1 Tax=Ralstonia solanacearum TaxID=305 RepID=A0AA92JU35_RALSL|nr:hypothetical protein [Ralstonia pseudosolanacearum]QOK92871.1 hypothetical protein HF908_16200 [Ralstonia pseudosolanacearum]QOK97768.1 hypothetical protein HF909_15930 [Ralstonia pseudosolanacearum]UWD90564.1 hypothetical protein NY025_23520 [Ralstonia pseudosolanacearum]CAH0445634.1 hypothetical protein LMG9673_04667 [Ralstonia pseudosolanacearum]
MGTTNNALPNWPREFYEPSDQSAFLFYVVFGANVGELRLSRSQYRCEGVPTGIDVMAYGPSEHAEVADSFRKGYVWDELQARRPALAADVAAQLACVIVRGSVPDAPSLNYFRDTIGLLTCLLDSGGVAIYDPQSFAWWSPDDWKARVFEPASPQPFEHVTILVSDEGGDLQWFHTRGLRKYGRPDLSLHGVPIDYRAAVVDLFNRFITFQASGGVIREGQQIRVQALPEGMVCVHGGDEDDPDFNNTRIEIAWPATVDG